MRPTLAFSKTNLMALAKNSKLAWALIFLFIVSIAIVLVLRTSQFINVSFVLNANHDTFAQIYYDRGFGFSEDESVKHYITSSEPNNILTRLPSDVKRLRLDPASSEIELNISAFRMWRGPGTPLTKPQASCLSPLHQITESSTVPKNTGSFISLGGDPQLEVSEVCMPRRTTPFDQLPYIAVILIITALFVWLIRLTVSGSRVSFFSFVSLVIGVYITLVLSVALFTPHNMHPDEMMHAAAAEYFSKNWLKKPINHPEMQSVIIGAWGTTYLNMNDAVYLLAAKSTSLLAGFMPEEFKRYRIFNVSLLVVLFWIFIVFRKRGIYFILMLGITPQVAYLFTYLNGDAISLSISFLLGFLFVQRHQIIIESFWVGFKASWVIALFGGLAVMLTFSRLHYLVFLFFIGGVIILYKPSNTPWFPQVTKTVMRLIIFYAFIFLPAGVAEIRSGAINDFQRSALIEAQRSEFAGNLLTIEGIRESGKNPHLRGLRHFGVPLSELLSGQPSNAGTFQDPRLVRYDWINRTWKWSFGVYGYHKLVSSEGFMKLSSVVALTAIILLFVFKIRISGMRYQLIVGFLLLSFAAVVVQSLMFSWVHSFQPQGRYLFAVFPMIAVALALGPRALSYRAYYFLVLVVFVVNVVGFAKYGVVPMISSA